MRSSYHLPSVGSLLRWGGLLAVVLAIVGGILGMHVIGGAPAGAMTPATVSSAVATAGVSATVSPLAAHPAPSHALPAGDLTVGPAKPGHQGSPVVCGCSPAGCDASMAMHGACVPSFGPAVLSVPLPGTLSHFSTGTAYVLIPGYKSGDRVPDPPSLTQLSISRT
ncbi:hypothetical protein [Arthrobacter sp. STN4]|uniref:hypothetical protein n=1 Tax=Arthrobacter sp. STN4 TaxID=2923276 RepID=UPI00211A21DF|nr:hypothetical protein [Arthrobacter sp. STN4]MCQ9164157.1 hypothetical protein [Arthrobacter sp. STN4]